MTKPFSRLARLVGTASLVVLFGAGLHQVPAYAAWGTSSRQTAPVAQTQTTLTVTQVLRNVREAMGVNSFQKQNKGVELRGAGRFLETDADYSLIVTPQGHFVQTITGPLGTISGFDGKQAWTVDWSGMPRLIGFEESEAAQTEIWLQTGLWALEKSPFTVTLVPEETTDQKVVLNLKLTQGLFESKVTLDRSTWLPQTMISLGTSGHRKLELSNYGAFLGFRVPQKMVQTSPGSTVSFQIKTVSRFSGGKANPFAPITRLPQDSTFDPSIPAALETKRARSGHLLVHPKVNGEDVGWFILDSGAGAMCINKSAAEKLKMPPIGKIGAVGVGGIVPSALRRGNSFSLGPVTISNLVFLDLDLDGIGTALGVQLGGICGYDLFSRAVVEVEFEPPAVALHAPGTYKLEKDAWQPLELEERHPVVACSFEGNRKELFKIDIGAGNALTFHTETVEKLKLLEQRETKEARSGGVGGTIQVRSGQIEWFEIAGHRFEKPTVEFSLAKTGAFSNRYLAGNIGVRFLKPFRVVLNYQQARIAFVEKAAAKG
ncbi:MAG: aspartyl protease family protein [Blastocatellia bacterium]|nr:aspartyl protease family protein [Blastocatellia bacterium]